MTCAHQRLAGEHPQILIIIHDQDQQRAAVAHTRAQEASIRELFNSSEKRLARVLLLLANFGMESKPGPLIAKISQEKGLHVHGSLLNVVLHD